MTERKRAGMSFETWVDSQISRAQARGDFDDLAGAGKPLPRRTSDESTYQWVIDKARQENIDVLGMLPPALALRKEREDLPRRAAALPSETAVRTLVEDFNERVRLFWRRPQEGPAVPVGLADVEALVKGWTAQRPPPAPAPAAIPAPIRPRRRLFWFFRRGAQPPGRTSPHS
ncbi:MAG: DnaJ-like, subfamily er 28, conserved domain protein [Blastococcus sp.]|nr:DnaJ-like, subfamily er 28, conserved domain protein [Blastococcus sp.]